jgi:hypothetical protein
MLKHYNKLYTLIFILLFLTSLTIAQDRYVCNLHGVENSSGLTSNNPTTIIGLWNSLSDNEPDAGDKIHIQNGYTYFVKKGSLSKKSRLAIIRGSANGYVTWIGDNVCTAGSHSGTDNNTHPIITGTENYSNDSDWSRYYSENTKFNIWYTDVQSEDFNVITTYPTKNWEPNTVFFKGTFEEKKHLVTWGRRQLSITAIDTIGEFYMERDLWLPNKYRIYVYSEANPSVYYEGVYIPEIAAGAWLIGSDDQVKLQHLEFNFFPTAISVSNTATDAIIEDCRFQWIGIGPDEGALAGWPANGDAINMQGRGTSAGSAKILNNYINECGVHGIYINSQSTSTFVENILVEGNQIFNCYHTGIDLQNIVSLQDMNEIVIRNNRVSTAVDTIINWNKKAPICVGIQVDGQEDTGGTEYNIDKIEIYNNIVVSNSHGINILDNVNGPCYIYENTVDKKDANTGNTYYAALYLQDLTQDIPAIVDVRNNIFQTSNSENWQIKIFNGSRMESKTLDNNLYWNDLVGAQDEFRGRYLGSTFTTLSDWQDTTGVDSLSQNGDTHFTGESDYAPLPESNAIDMGRNLPERFNVDIMGTSRPQGSNGTGGEWDAGAYEYIFTHSVVLSVNDILPEEFSLDVYPNPFNPSTNIKVSLNTRSAIKIYVYNILGSLVRTIAEDIYEAGSHTFIFNGNDFSSGVYVLTVERNTNLISKKIVLLK